MNAKKISASIAVVASIAANSNNAAATIHHDRYSGFACEGVSFVDYPEHYPYDWIPGTTANGFYCPITNWFPSGLADVTDVFVQYSTPHVSSQYECHYMEPNYHFTYSGPSAKACVLYASFSGSTFGSSCGLLNETLANASAGANHIHLSTAHLSAWQSSYPFGGAYVVVSEGGTADSNCPSTSATFRTLTVISDI